MDIVTRFAPSPTGYLHKGHALSALLSFEHAQKAGGRFLLRIEDIDITRTRPAFIEAIKDDLTWLGLTWELPVRNQSDHFGDYQTALQHLIDRDLAYPCFCTRKDIASEIKAAGGAPHGPDGHIYPGTCKTISVTDRHKQMTQTPYAWRLDMGKALSQIKRPLTWKDERFGEITAKPERFGDIVLARKDIPTSYHMAVVYDDALQGITHITRGQDLFDHTDIHVLLQALFDYPTPRYHHHPLLYGPDGKRLAKRNKAATLASLRAEGVTANDIRRELLPCP